MEAGTWLKVIAELLALVEVVCKYGTGESLFKVIFTWHAVQQVPVAI